MNQPPEAGIKARGAYFTPPEIAAWLADWAIRRPEDRVLEPACGEAAFLLAAAARLSALGAPPGPGGIAGQLAGSEVHAASARRAAARLAARGYGARIVPEDFFARRPAPEFDAVIGNPPFVRFQAFRGSARAGALRAARAAGVRLSGLASSWAAFVVHASRFLRPGGRLALVLPAELLSVNYAAEVRQFLLARFARVRLVGFTARVFAEVAEEVVLLLAEGEGGTPGFEMVRLADAMALAPPESLAWTAQSPDADGKWTPALADAAALDLYRRVTQGAGFAPLRTWGTTSLGAVTGANDFFAVDAATVARLGLAAEDLLAISPPGSRHLRGGAFTREAWQRLAGEGASCWLVRPRAEAAVPAWLEEGRRRGVAAAYKCRTRTPWWRVPLPACPDLLLTYMTADGPRLLANAAGVQVLNSLYGVVLRPEVATPGRELLPLAFRNSATLLGAEILGRSYGGGLLKLEPREAARLPVPTPEALAARAPALRRLPAGEATVAEVDAVVLDGLSPAERAALGEARRELAARRRARRRRPPGAG